MTEKEMENLVFKLSDDENALLLSVIINHSGIEFADLSEFIISDFKILAEMIADDIEN